MAQVDLTAKYSNFYAPKNQIIVNSEDLHQKYGITASTLSVEQNPSAPKFRFTVNDPQSAWINTALFEPGQKVFVKMGYGAVLETVMEGEVSEVKSVFSADRGPQIEVLGASNPRQTPRATNAVPVCTLAFGSTLLNFTAIAAAENQPKTTAISRVPALKATAASLRCVAESIGLPEVRDSAAVALTGLGQKFNLTYLVEKAIHSWDNNFGFMTLFEAKARV
ncbi:MAG: hypothetical protein NWE93_10950 [Candidatus Bathyarchaeota archaeon]|nr:hypothetical protein [Candidatus Bathyarchaeota archaeon]